MKSLKPRTDQVEVPGLAIVDRNIVKLVESLGRVPGIWTSASCGGHRNPKAGQAGPNRYYVSFGIDRTRLGWAALALLTYAIYRCEMQQLIVTLKPWCPDESPETIMFQIDGVGRSRIVLADEIDLAVAEAATDPRSRSKLKRR